MKRILFLDDDGERRVQFGEFCFKGLVYPEWALTAIDAFDSLAAMAERGEVFDFVSLDHDLSGGAFEPSDYRSGYAVARYIALMPPELRPKEIILHSHNYKGVANMACSLPTAIRAEFGTPAYWERVREALQ